MNMRVDSACKNLALYITTKRNIIVCTLSVCDANRVLLDDGAFVEVRRDVV